MNRREAIKDFLDRKALPHMAAMYRPSMEVQVNVAQGNGERIVGEFAGKKWTGWTDGKNTWKNFRIPFDARKEPHYTDSEMKFSLDEHCEGIGMTGWDWESRVSRWVAFDFDSIINHQSGLTSQQLDEIVDKVRDVPWVTVLKSTSGRGLHLYVDVPDIPTANHCEHANLARCILSQLSAKTGFNFQASVDVAGGNMWVWHRKSQNTDGFSVIKQGELHTDIPENWRDYTGEVVRPAFLQSVSKKFDELMSVAPRVAFDAEHRKLIKYLEDTKAAHWTNNGMLVCHTFDLAKAHVELGLVGLFATTSTGKDRGRDLNCFCFPLKNGGWIVRRYSQHCREHPCWETDKAGWTKIAYNVEPSLRVACMFREANEVDIDCYSFKEAAMAAIALSDMGFRLDIPDRLSYRRTKLSPTKDDRINIEIQADADDPSIPGWERKDNVWAKILNFRNQTVSDPTRYNYDDSLRFLVSEDGIEIGWVLKTDDRWIRTDIQKLKLWMTSENVTPKDANMALGQAVSSPWTVVSIPFGVEYPGGRKWNMSAAGFRYAPSRHDNLNYPHWKRILNHIGKCLDADINKNKWCQTNGIKSGADYLMMWIAAMFQKPLEPLPFLFLYGPQNSGKSILHEALSLLITRGVMRGDTSLNSSNSFNAELFGAVLCVIEEVDLSKSSQAYNRIKDWVTSRTMQIHEKGKTPYTVTNTTHWIQCANSAKHCPIFPGDTRITIMQVPQLEEEIPKAVLIRALEKEAPDFLAEVLQLELPQATGRLSIPVIDSEGKRNIALASNDPLSEFIAARIHMVPGSRIKLRDFYEAFVEYVGADVAMNWNTRTVSVSLQKDHDLRVGGATDDHNHRYVGNVSFDPATKPSQPYRVNHKGMLIKESSP